LFFVNAALTAKPRTETVSGTEYLVAPIRMMRQGVFSGSRGPVFYSSVENEKSTELWNGMPIVLGHPKRNGKHVSARTAKMLRESVGVIQNSSTSEKGDLEAEAWIDIKAADTKDKRILEGIYNGQALPVSTGISKARLIEVDGVYNGDSYNFSAADINPDHLAILLDEPAACSIDQGCGILVNELTHGSIQTALNQLVRNYENDDEIWVGSDDILSRSAIYSRDGMWFKIKYTKSDNQVKLVGVPVEVVREVKFRPVLNSSEKENAMKKDELVDTIVNSGCDCWSEDDSEILNDFTVPKLKNILKGIEASDKNTELVNSIQEGFEDEHVKVSFVNGKYTVEQKVAGEPKEEEVKIENAAKAEISLEQLPAEMREDIEYARQTRQRQHAEIVNSLLEDIADEKKEALTAVLNSKSIDELETLRELKGSAPAKVEATPRYAGRASRTVPVTNATGPRFAESEKLEVPYLSWD